MLNILKQRFFLLCEVCEYTSDCDLHVNCVVGHFACLAGFDPRIGLIILPPDPACETKKPFSIDSYIGQIFCQNRPYLAPYELG